MALNLNIDRIRELAATMADEVPPLTEKQAQDVVRLLSTKSQPKDREPS